MTKLEQAARQALEALVKSTGELHRFLTSPTDMQLITNHNAITALREALDPELQFVQDWNEGKVRRVSDGKVMGFAEQAEPSQLADASLEPVAWILTEADGTMDFDCQPTIKPTQNDYDALREGETFTPLYAAPLAQQDTHATHVVRTKDLSDDEIGVIIEQVRRVSPLHSKWDFARAVIAAYKEKNK